jgi:hypothetical protein
MDGSEVKTLGRVGEWMVMEGSGVKTRMERGKRWFRIEV